MPIGLSRNALREQQPSKPRSAAQRADKKGVGRLARRVRCFASPQFERGVDAIYAAKVTLSIAVYCFSVSVVPIYNRRVFSGQFGVASFPFPNATAFLQLGFVSLLLTVFDVVSYRLCSHRRQAGDSWLFGPHFLYKLRHCAPAGILFGIKYGVTNWGLELVPVGTHVLFQSTNLVWTVILAWLVNKEQLGFMAGCGVIFATCGSVLTSLRVSTMMQEPLVPLAVNLLTPLVLALCITTLRQGAKELTDPRNRLGGTVSPAEFTALKLGFGSVSSLLIAMVLENDNVQRGNVPPEAWWVALGNYPGQGIGLILLGSILALIFHVNITWMAVLTSSATLGIVGELKVVPQWLFNVPSDMSGSLDLTFLAGVVLTFFGSGIYVFEATGKQRLALSWRGFEWRCRQEEAGTDPGSENANGNAGLRGSLQTRLLPGSLGSALEELDRVMKSMPPLTSDSNGIPTLREA